MSIPKHPHHAPLAEPPAGPLPAEAAPAWRLASGRRLSLVEEGEQEILTVSAPDGRVELSIRFTEAGPVLSFEAAAVRLKSRGEVSVECDRFRVDAARSLTFHTGGEEVHRADGEISLEAGASARVAGHAVDLRARRGDMTLKANDDLKLNAERVKLNC